MASPAVRFDPIQPQRAHEYVAEQIRRHISLRLVLAGEALPPERELARLFEVGRPTVQQALRELEADGLVEARRGRGGGTFVSHPPEGGPRRDELIERLLLRRAELDELLVYRRVVEPAAARVAAETRRKSDLEAMRLADRRWIAARDEPAYMRHDTEFHLALARATGNGLLVATLEDVRTRLGDALGLLPESDLWARRISGEHAAVIAAIEARDGDAADAAMREHVVNAERSVRALLAAIRRRVAR